MSTQAEEDIPGSEPPQAQEPADARFRTLLQQSAEAIVLITAEGIITSATESLQAVLGYRPDELIGTPVFGYIHPEDLDTIVGKLAEVLQAPGAHVIVEYRARHKNGSWVWLEATGSNYLHDPQIRAIIGNFRNVNERKQIEANLRFLSEASKLLSSSLDYQTTLTHVTYLAVPHIADWCTIEMRTDEGIQQLALAHVDPEKVQWARELNRANPPDPQAPTGIPNVLRTGKPEFYPVIDDAFLVAAAHNDEELALMRYIGFSSAMVVPLLIEGEAIGAITFVAAESGRHYTQADLSMAEELASRAALAIQNAQLYREAQQARDQVNIILQGVADGIVVYTPDGRLLYANQAAARMTGFASVEALLTMPSEEVVNRYDLIDEQGKPVFSTALPHRRVLAGEPEAQTVIGYTEPRTGQPVRWSLVTSRPVLDENGAVALAISILHDITERMLVERRKDEFISMTSHELKTPVTSLKGFTNVLQRRLTKQADTQGLHYLARMDAQLDKLTTLINDLLDISRMQSGKLELRAELFDLDTLIDETVENVQMATTTHRLLVEGRTGAQVFGDKERLAQVYINLLTNAIKYSAGADRVLVHLLRDNDGQQAIVRVQDFGIGIDQRHHDKIFDRFYQVTDPAEKTYPGLGIGLYISSEIIARHQGRIWVESCKGQGSIFSVALPIFSQREAD